MRRAMDPDSLNPDTDPDPAFKWILIRIQSGPRVLMTKNLRKKLQQKVFFLFLKNCNVLMSKLQAKPSALKREHPGLQKMNFINFFLCLWVIFCPPGSGSGYGSRDRIESGSNLEPDLDQQCCGSRSGIRDLGLFDPWIRDPGSGIGLFRIPDLGSRIPNSYFWELSDNFLGKKFHNSLKFGPNFFLEQFKN